MNINSMQDKKHLHNSDFDAQGTSLVMKSMQQEELGKEKDLKWILYFEGQKKGFALNVINTKRIGRQHGQETDNWWGKSITLHCSTTEYEGDDVACIRVKMTDGDGIPF